MIPKELVLEIRDRNDIEDVIGGFVDLKRAGANIKGLCPFHNEKTPSFTVFPATQSFYCFGCGAGGDVITFIMKYQNLDYADAVEYLAARAGINIPVSTFGEEEKGPSRKRILEMNVCAARYFREMLFSPEGKAGLDYLLQKRKLSPAIIRRFGLGFAPDSPFAMLDYMRKQGYTDEELRAGYFEAVSQRTNRPYSIFRNRVMFPIINSAGSVIAFGGRVMDDSKPKYLNTNDTPAYKKGKNLFALNYAKDCCGERLILCEGYMDVIALHAAGFGFAVAGLGTALTSDQARLIAKYTKKVILTYDSDEAGQRATERAISLLSEVGVDVKVLVVEGAKDPDEFIGKYGAAAFERLLDGSRSKFSYRADAVIKKHDIATADGKLAAAKELCAIVAAAPSSVERDLNLDEAARLLSIDKKILAEDVARARRKLVKEEKNRLSLDAYTSARGIGDRVNPDTAKNVGAASAEETILGLLLAFPEHRAAVASGKIPLTADDFVTAFGRRVFEAVMKLEVSDGGFDISLLGEEFSPDEMGRLQRMIRERMMLTENSAAVLASSAETLRFERVRQTAKESGDRLAAFEAKRRLIMEKKKKNT